VSGFSRTDPALSGMFQESEIEGREYQNDPYIYRQPFPESVPEEQNIDSDDHGCQQQYVKYGSRLSSHFGYVQKSLPI
jgi:hypothetical protein